MFILRCLKLVSAQQCKLGDTQAKRVRSQLLWIKQYKGVALKIPDSFFYLSCNFLYCHAFQPSLSENTSYEAIREVLPLVAFYTHHIPNR